MKHIFCIVTFVLLLFSCNETTSFKNIKLNFYFNEKFDANSFIKNDSFSKLFYPFPLCNDSLYSNVLDVYNKKISISLNRIDTIISIDTLSFEELTWYDNLAKHVSSKSKQRLSEDLAKYIKKVKIEQNFNLDHKLNDSIYNKKLLDFLLINAKTYILFTNPEVQIDSFFKNYKTFSNIDSLILHFNNVKCEYSGRFNILINPVMRKIPKDSLDGWPSTTSPSPSTTSPSPTPTKPSPTPTKPLPTPTKPSPTPTKPSPTPTKPSPTPTKPSPTPTKPSPPSSGPKIKEEVSIAKIAQNALDRYDLVNNFYLSKADARQKRIIEVYYSRNSAIIRKLNNRMFNEVNSTQLFSFMGDFDELIKQFSIQ
jgi:hypothetical protein